MDNGNKEVHMEQRTEKCNGKDTVVITGTIGIPTGGRSLLEQGPSDYLEFSGLKNSYKFHPEKVSWPQANAICEAEGAHLAIVNSPLEARFLASLVDTPEDDHRAFLGFHDLYKDGKFVTVFNQSLEDTGFNDWGEGKQGNDENCGVLRKFKLGDHGCNVKLPFLCERENKDKE